MTSSPGITTAALLHIAEEEEEGDEDHTNNNEEEENIESEISNEMIIQLSKREMMKTVSEATKATHMAFEAKRDASMRPVAILSLLLIMEVTFYGMVVVGQVNGSHFKKKYPRCDIDVKDVKQMNMINDGQCNNG